MKSISRTFLTLATAAVLTASARAQNGTSMSSVLEKTDIALYGRLQMLGFGQAVKDNIADDRRLYLFLKQARFGIRSTYEDTRFDLQVAFGGEGGILAPSPGISLSLLDMSVDFPLVDALRLKVGQFKVPFGRESITNSGDLQFNDRSIQDLALRLGRDVGFALYGSSGLLTGTLGVFTGGGRDVPIRYIPQSIGLPLTVLRVGINNGLDEDVLTLGQTGYSAHNGYAIYVDGAFTKDSRVGHSTALNVKTADKSLLLNTVWNPYLGTKPFDKGDLKQVGVDGAYRTALDASTTFNVEAEANYGTYANKYGNLATAGGRVQVGVFRKPYELALRYAVISPDSKFATLDSKGKAYPIVSGSPIHEITFGATYYLRGEHLKVGVDFPILIGAPVVQDAFSGAYVLTEQPDQATYATEAGNSPAQRQTVVEARVQLQYAF